MPNYFFDSSALVKRYRREVGTLRVSELLAAANRSVVSRLTPISLVSSDQELNSAALVEGLAILDPTQH